MSDPYKVALVGESGVGKTCIISKFINGKFDPSTESSHTSQFIRKTIEFPKGKSLTFDLWDTSGRKEYRSLAKIFYKDAKAVILVYDVTKEKSFTEMKSYWYEQIKELGRNDIIFAIAANKSDLYKEKQVDNEKGEEFAKRIGAIFYSISAKNGLNIATLFDNVGREMIGSSDKNSKLLNELNKYKSENEELKNENEELKTEIEKLKEENNKLNNDLLKANKIISNFNNNQNDNHPNDKMISKLNKELLMKEDIINNLKNQIKNSNITENTKLFGYEDILFVHFISMDQKVNCPIKCLSTDTFAEVEEKLYQKYAEYRETNNNFIAKGKVVLRFKKICENNIKDGDKIQLLPPMD